MFHYLWILEKARNIREAVSYKSSMEQAHIKFCSTFHLK